MTGLRAVWCQLFHGYHHAYFLVDCMAETMTYEPRCAKCSRPLVRQMAHGTGFGNGLRVEATMQQLTNGPKCQPTLTRH